MKYFLLFFIKVYQTLIPKRFRGKCLFKESCSNYVYRTAKEEGLMKGLSALKYRYNNCRPNYYLMKDKDKTVLITAKYVIIEENLIDERILLKNKEKL